MKLSYGGLATKGWNHFYGASRPLKTLCKNFNEAIGGGIPPPMDEWNGYKMEQGKVYISCNYSTQKLKYFYIQYEWISVMKKQNSNHGVRVEKIVVSFSSFDHYHHKFQLFFSLSCTGFPKWDQLVRWQFGQNGQKLHENDKVNIFRSKQRVGGHANFLASRGYPPSLP